MAACTSILTSTRSCEGQTEKMNTYFTSIGSHIGCWGLGIGALALNHVRPFRLQWKDRTCFRTMVPPRSPSADWKRSATDNRMQIIWKHFLQQKMRPLQVSQPCFFPNEELIHKQITRNALQRCQYPPALGEAKRYRVLLREPRRLEASVPIHFALHKIPHS